MEGFSDSHLERELIAEATKLQRALWQALVNVGKPTTPVRDLLDLYNHANDQPTRDRNQKGAQYTGVCAGVSRWLYEAAHLEGCATLAQIARRWPGLGVERDSIVKAWVSREVCAHADRHGHTRPTLAGSSRPAAPTTVARKAKRPVSPHWEASSDESSHSGHHGPEGTEHPVRSRRQPWLYGAAP